MTPPTLSAEACVALARPDHYLARLYDFFAQYYKDAHRTPTEWHIRTPIGTLAVHIDGNSLVLRAEAEEPGALATLKDAMATYLEKFAIEERPEISWTGDGCDTTELPNFRRLTVTNAVNITRRMRRLTMAGENLARFAEHGLHIRLAFPPPGVTPQWPTMGRNGRPLWPPSEHCPILRTYTIRSIDADAGRLEVDFVMHHDAGVGSRWAANARVGDPVGMLGPGGGVLPAADWYLFACDETGIPAASRMLEMLDASKSARAFFEVDDEDEIQPLRFQAAVEVMWLFRNGAPAGHSDLLRDAALAAVFPSDRSVFAWSAAEAATAKAIRTVWSTIQRPSFRWSATGYWKRGRNEEEYRLEAAD